MYRNTRGHIFKILFGVLKWRKKFLPKGMFLSHIEVTIFFNVRFVFFFMEELELNLFISKFKGFYTSVSLRKQPTFSDITTGFPVKWCLRNQRRNSILMTCHYPLMQTFNQSEALPRSKFWRIISIGFLHWFLRRHFVGNQ